MSDHNRLRIIVHPTVFEIKPSPELLEVTSFEQKILVLVDWRDNQDKWKKVEICDFVATKPFDFQYAAKTIHKDDYLLQEIDIVFTKGEPSSDIPVKYAIKYHPTAQHGDIYCWDPGVIFKPAGGVGDELP